jgi:hypothetical protein
MKMISGCLLGALLIAIGSAYAKECVNEKNVITSTASAAQNDSDQGHVSRHVDTLPTETNNSQFMHWTDFTGVFAAMQKLAAKNPKPWAKCNQDSSGSQTDCIDLKDAGLAIAGQLCTAADAKGGCTTKKKINPVSVVFHYLNDNSTKNKWIVHTAYPSTQACSK